MKTSIVEKKFNNIAQVLVAYRTAANKSQGGVSREIGFKNGQFISNCERGLCTIPAKKLRALSESIECPIGVLKKAMVDDYKARIENVCEKQDKNNYWEEFE